MRTATVLMHTETQVVVDVPEANRLVQVTTQNYPALSAATHAEIDAVEADAHTLRWPALNVEVPLTADAVRPFRFYV